MRRLWALGCRAGLVGAVGLFGFTGVTFGLVYPGFIIVAAGVAIWRSVNRPQAGWTHGTARFSYVSEMAAKGLLAGYGLVLGRLGEEGRPTRWQGLRALLSFRVDNEAACRAFLGAFFGSRWAAGQLVRIRKFVHLITIAPTGRGKSVSVLLPNLLSYRGACVVIDPKGELFRATAEHRRCEFGHKIFRFDPFNVCGLGGDSLNVLSFLDADDPSLIEQCRDIANQMVDRSAGENDPYWNDQAENIIATFLYYIALCEPNAEERHLQTLRDILSDRRKYGRAIEAMQQNPDDEVLQRLGNLSSWLQDKELNSIMSSVSRHTQWMDSPLVAASMLRSTFDPRALRSKATLYIILPHDKLTVLRALLRLYVGSTLRILARRGADEHNPVLFLVDETAHLGQVKALEDSVTLMRGMGIRLWFFFQSLDQMKQCFGDRSNVVLGNIDTQQYFGINDYPTAEELSKRMGNVTITLRSFNITKGWTQPRGCGGGQATVSQSTSVTTSESSRRLKMAEEVLTMDDGLSLLFHRNMHAIAARLVYHYADPEFVNGGTGQQRGLGLAAGVMAAVTLAGSLWFAAFLRVPMPISQRQLAAVRQGYAAAASWLGPAGDYADRPTGGWRSELAGLRQRAASGWNRTVDYLGVRGGWDAFRAWLPEGWQTAPSDYSRSSPPRRYSPVRQSRQRVPYRRRGPSGFLIRIP